jgi:hypothetical protein
VSVLYVGLERQLNCGCFEKMQEASQIARVFGAKKTKISAHSGRIYNQHIHNFCVGAILYFLT